MIKAHKIRLNPTLEQEAYFRRASGTARFVYNWGLAEWKHHKAASPGEKHGVMAIKKDFNALKGQQYPWVYEVAKDVAEGAFQNLGQALENHYASKSGRRQGAQMGFPHFKSKKNKRQSFRLNNDKFKVSDHSLYVPKLGWVNMAEALRFEGKIMGAVVSKSVGHWHAVIAVEMEAPAPLEFPKESTGVDIGIQELLVLSDGRRYENQAPLRSELRHLKFLNRQLARRKKGSRRWYKAKQQMEVFHGRIANRRADQVNKMTTAVAKTYRMVGMEDLNAKGMVRNHHLALSLSDAAFGEIKRQMQYKKEWFGGKVVLVNRFFPSSRMCSACKHLNTDLELSDREWTCANCGTHHLRDDNAANNIEQEALRLFGSTPVVATSGILARGRDVRPHYAAIPVEASISKRSLLST
jgi:putative transposase